MANVASPAKKRAAKAKAEPAPEQEIVAFKAFDKDLKCRGFQYEIGSSYEHTGSVAICERASAKLHIEAELTLPDFIKKSIAWIAEACKLKGSTGHYAKNASSGHYAKNASSGDSAKNASSGDYATNASSGDSAKNASSGDSATNASSGHSATNASSGHYAKNEASGEYSVIAAAGRNSYAKGAKGVWISLAEYQEIDGQCRCIGFATGQAGFDGVPADTWLIARSGKLVAS